MSADFPDGSGSFLVRAADRAQAQACSVVALPTMAVAVSAIRLTVRRSRALPATVPSLSYGKVPNPSV